MSAVYLGPDGYARYYEDSRTGPLPAGAIEGLERLPVNLDRLWPIDIVAAEREYQEKS